MACVFGKWRGDAGGGDDAWEEEAEAEAEAEAEMEGRGGRCGG
jgi:hypothetical protein